MINPPSLSKPGPRQILLVDTMHETPRESYVDHQFLTRTLLLILVVRLIARSIYFLCHAVVLGYLIANGAAGAVAIPPDLASNLNAVLAEASPVFFIASALSVVVMLRWMARMNNNLRAVGTENLTFTPRGCALSFAIPIVNLWWPLKAMREIWAACKSDDHRYFVESLALVNIWWILFLVSPILARTSDRIVPGARGLDDMLSTYSLATIGDVLVMLATLVAILVVRSINTSFRHRFIGEPETPDPWSQSTASDA